MVPEFAFCFVIINFKQGVNFLQVKLVSVPFVLHFSDEKAIKNPLFENMQIKIGCQGNIYRCSALLKRQELLEHVRS